MVEKGGEAMIPLFGRRWGVLHGYYMLFCIVRNRWEVRFNGVLHVVN